MRVLYFSESYTGHDRRFLTRIANSNYEIFYLNLVNDEIEETILKKKIQEIKLDQPLIKPFTLDDLLNVEEEVKKHFYNISPDLVHTGPIQTCGYLTARTGFHPFLLMSWGYDLLLTPESSIINKKITIFTLDKSDYLLCDSQAVFNKANEFSLFVPEKTLFLPWGVELEEFQPEKEDVMQLTGEAWCNNLVLISTRKWEAVYGIDVLLKAFYLSYSEDKNLRLILLSCGDLEPFVKSFIRDNDLTNVISTPGEIPRNQLSKYYRVSDVYLSCAYIDGTSVSLLEAMATGLPVIVTDMPSNREWVKHGYNGWLCTPGDETSFKNSIFEAISTENSYKNEMGRRSRDVVENYANWYKNSSKLLDFYKKIIVK